MGFAAVLRRSSALKYAQDIRDAPRNIIFNMKNAIYLALMAPLSFATPILNANDTTETSPKINEYSEPGWYALPNILCFNLFANRSQ